MYRIIIAKRLLEAAVVFMGWATGAVLTNF